MEESKQTVLLENRKKLILSGITEVNSFLEDRAEVQSLLGVIQITGAGLHLEKLDLEKGELIITGVISSLYYPDEAEREQKGFLKRIFS